MSEKVLITVRLSEKTLEMAASCLWDQCRQGERNPEMIKALRELMAEEERVVTVRRPLSERQTEQLLLLKIRQEIRTRGIY